MNIPYIQPGAYFLPKHTDIPLRILKVQNGFIHYTQNDKEFTVSINKLRWIEHQVNGEALIINDNEVIFNEELTIENLWVEM